MATQALAVIEGPGTVVAPLAQPPRLTLLRPVATPAEVVQAQEDVREMIAATLKEGRDYGKVPGTDKNSLFKPGAERVCGFFGLTARFRIVEKEVEHDREVPWRKTKIKYQWSKGPDGKSVKGPKIGEEVTEGVSLGLYRYVIECELVHRESGQVVASCIGSCSTMESKYIDRPRDSENTIVKMSEKRAYVGAALLAGGLSDMFTQDVEDLPREMFDKGAASDVASDGASAEPGVGDNGRLVPMCPKCGGNVWDNRDKKASGQIKANAPDFKCRDKACDTPIWPGQWPPKDDAQKTAEKIAAQQGAVEKRKARAFPQTFPVKELRGRTIGSVSREELVQALMAAREKDAQAWVDLLGEELEERNVAAQTDLGVSGAASASAGGPVSMPAAGPVGAALAPNEVRPAALADGDDDLPF